jgi:hypothetical protein
MIIIGISGVKYSGKDTFGDYIVENYGFHKLSFARPIKDSLAAIFHFTPDQIDGDLKEVVDEYWGHSPRELLQKFGDELCRQELPRICSHITQDIWVKSLERKMEILKQQGVDKIVITDVRYPNELEFIKNKNGKVITVTRPNNIDNNGFKNHSSEKFAGKMDTEYHIVNDAPQNEPYCEHDKYSERRKIHHLDNYYRKIDTLMNELGFYTFKK